MTKVETKLETILLTNEYGMSVEILNFGARIKSIKFPVDSIPTEMTLGYASDQEYLKDEFYLGATCGRVCNRIAGGKLQLDGNEYQLSQNDGDNCLHGGKNNFSFRFWQVDKKTVTKTSVTLSLLSENGDQGFPGNVNLTVTYQLSNDNQLSMHYSANTDCVTAINLTNHTYFNLGEEDAECLYLQINSSAYLETTCQNIPTGKILTVDATDFDFSEPTNIGIRQSTTSEKSLREKQGYDHCFILDDSAFEQPKAVLTSLRNQISLSVYTDQPAIQLYTGFYLNGVFKSYQGLCLEAQNHTDADNIAHFPSNILRQNEQYQRKIVYKFEHI